MRGAALVVLPALASGLWGALIGRLVTLAGVAWFGYGYLNMRLTLTAAGFGVLMGAWLGWRSVDRPAWRDLALGIGLFMGVYYLIGQPIQAVQLGIGVVGVIRLNLEFLPSLPKYFITTEAPIALGTTLGARAIANWVRSASEADEEPAGDSALTRREDGTWEL